MNVLMNKFIIKEKTHTQVKKLIINQCSDAFSHDLWYLAYAGAS